MSPGSIKLIIIGVTAIIEIILAYFIYKQFKLRSVFTLTETSRAKEVNYEGLVEVKGEVVCPKPITVMGVPCVYYRYVRERLRSRYGRSYRSGWSTDYTEKRHVPFFVKDETGLVQVNPEGAETDNRTLHRGYDSGDLSGTILGSIGGVLTADTGVTRDKLTGISVGDRAYVVGSAVRHGKVFIIEKGPYGPLFISNKSEETVKRNRLLWGVGLAVLALAIPTLLAIFWNKIPGM